MFGPKIQFIEFSGGTYNWWLNHEGSRIIVNVKKENSKIYEWLPKPVTECNVLCALIQMM